MGGNALTYLMDTSVWLRAIVEPETLPVELRDILNARDEPFGLAAISLWEVGKKQQIGKLKLKKELGIWLQEAVAVNVEILPLTHEIVSEAMRLPNFPNRDPAELIVATARIHQLILLTTDSMLKGYRHARVRYFKPLLA